ncbi:MAG: DUF294 nucleotidyltransferase-like domain-containing protein [Terrimicrobiaceae bacterium]
MKTSAIILRVADFLKGFPPFCFLEEPALMELASSGRVRFCEKGEILFEEGKERDRYVFVINKGSLRLVKGIGDQRVLMDLRGRGDFAGSSGILGGKAYEMSALVDEDSVIYALDAGLFAKACLESPQASRFLATYFSSGDSSADTNKLVRRWPNSHMEALVSKMVSGPQTSTVREAAGAMAAADSSVFVVLDARGQASGIITDVDLRNKVATGGVPLDALVDQVMQSPVHCLARNTSPEDSLLHMIRHNVHHLCVTTSGSELPRAVGVLTDSEVSLAHGNNPLAFVREVHTCHSPRMMGHLREALSAMLLYLTKTPEDIPWCEKLATEIRRVIFQRVEAWAREAMTEQPCALEFALAGCAGRGEALTRTAFPSVIIFEDRGNASRVWMRDLLQRVDDLLAEAGFPSPETDASFDRVRSVEEWKAIFRQLITDHLGSGVWQKMAFFDLSTVSGNRFLLDRVQEELTTQIRANARFVPLLANDALGNLPPVTIFEGYAVGVGGLLQETVNLTSHALAPISDMARVFHLEGDQPAVTNTMDRLVAAAGRLPAWAPQFHAAATAFQTAQFFIARNGLPRGTVGDELRMVLLPRTEQVLLKSAFRAIAELMTLTANHHGLQR